jgi:hypothetical protein
MRVCCQVDDAGDVGETFRVCSESQGKGIPNPVPKPFGDEDHQQFELTSMTAARTFNVLQEIKTPSEPDVLLFSPIDPTVLIAGTYHLQEDGSRIGSLLVYRIVSSTSQWY